MTQRKRRGHTTKPLWPHFNHQQPDCLFQKMILLFLYMPYKTGSSNSHLLIENGFMSCPGLSCRCLLTFQSNRVIYFLYSCPEILGNAFISSLLWRHQSFYLAYTKASEGKQPFLQQPSGKSLILIDSGFFCHPRFILSIKKKKSFNGLRTSAWNMETPKKNA